MSLKDSILACKPSVEPVQAFSETCYVREMTGQEVSDFQRWATSHADADGMTAMIALLVRTLCDEQGERIFQDDEAEQLAALPTRDIQAAYQASERLNMPTNEDVEDAVKN